VVPQAYLRVFQPLSAFASGERGHWERYLVEGRHLRRLPPPYRQHLVAGRLGLLAPSESEDADIRLIDGEYYICPWRTRIRILSSLLQVRGSTAPEIADQLVPEAEAKRAARELSRLRRRDPAAVPFMLQSPWHVPLRWFLLFKDEERSLTEDPAGGWRLTYSTTVGRARRRLDWALDVVRRADLEPLIEVLEDLSRWLAAFDRHSLLELDYAGLSSLLTWDELDEDHSATEVLEAIEALNAREPSRSADLYQSVAGRWAEIRSHESLN
jgi:hypothetical protein